MTQLSLTVADVKRLCAVDPADTSQDAAMAALMAAEQPVHEYALDPGILAGAVAPGGDAGLKATLTLGVAEVLAGDYLQTVARGLDFEDSFQVGTLRLVTRPAQTPGALGLSLTRQGLARLAPFTRAARAQTGGAAGATPDDWAPVPQLIAASPVAGASSGAPGSVFDAVFADGEGPEP